MLTRFVVALLLAAPLSSASAQFTLEFSLPGVSIGVRQPEYPRLVRVPGYPVYYDPQADSNYFFYEGLYWVYQGDDWYASEWYDGPWGRVDPQAVPVFILRVPVRYYRHPPAYFQDWRRDAPPRWGEHWGRDWEHNRPGWDRWNRRRAPAPAPLPVYQRRYSGDRYPQPEQQTWLHRDNYRYAPRDTAVRSIVREPAPQERRQHREDRQRAEAQQQAQQQAQARQQQAQQLEAQQQRAQQQQAQQRQAQERQRMEGERRIQQDQQQRAQAAQQAQQRAQAQQQRAQQQQAQVQQQAEGQRRMQADQQARAQQQAQQQQAQAQQQQAQAQQQARQQEAQAQQQAQQHQAQAQQAPRRDRAQQQPPDGSTQKRGDGKRGDRRNGQPGGRGQDQDEKKD